MNAQSPPVAPGETPCPASHNFGALNALSNVNLSHCLTCGAAV